MNPARYQEVMRVVEQQTRLTTQSQTQPQPPPDTTAPPGILPDDAAMDISPVSPTVIQPQTETQPPPLSDTFASNSDAVAAIQLQPPLWTPHRNYLSEALDYIRSSHSNECIDNGVVISAVVRAQRGPEVVSEGYTYPGSVSDQIDGIEGGGSWVRRTTREYLDRDVCIFAVAGKLKGVRGGVVDGYRGKGDKKVEKVEKRHKEEVVKAWKRTEERGVAFVLVVERGFGGLGLGVRGGGVLDSRQRWVVLGHFLASDVWAERIGGSEGEVVWMVKVQKVEMGVGSWWWTGMERAMGKEVIWEERNGFDAWGRRTCERCGIRWPRVFAEGWRCLNEKCNAHWSRKEGTREPGLQMDKWEWNKEFLKPAARVVNKEMRPSYALVPDLKGMLERSGASVASSRSWYRAMVCPGCKSIVAKVYWKAWICLEELCRDRLKYVFEPGRIPLETIVPRVFVSYEGHPPLNPQWSLEGFGDRVRTHRNNYTVDRWEDLHAGYQLIVLSPTAGFNNQPNGPDWLYERVLQEVNKGTVQLQRWKNESTNELDSQYHWNAGVQYGFSQVHAAERLGGASAGITAAKQLLDECAEHELHGNWTGHNNIQVLAYLEGMKMPWGVDGDHELGATATTLNLGGDAIFRLRLRKEHYENDSTSAEDGEVVKGSKSQQAAATKAPYRRGQAVRPEGLFESSYEARNARRPEITVPLIHGSIVIRHGQHFSQYYEHSTEPQGPLHVAITARSIDSTITAEMIKHKHPHVPKRMHGQLYTSDISFTLLNSTTPTTPGFSLPLLSPTKPSSKRRRRSSSTSTTSTSTSTSPSPHRRLKHRRPGHPTKSHNTPAPATSTSSRSTSPYSSSASDQRWTLDRLSRLIYLRDHLQLGYKEIIAREGWVWWKEGALRTAAERERKKLRKAGVEIREPSHVVARPSGRSSASPASRAGSEGVVGGQRENIMAGVEGAQWTQEELEELIRLRDEVSPKRGYKDVAVLMGGRRTPKALREMYGLEKRRREGREVSRPRVDDGRSMVERGGVRWREQGEGVEGRAQSVPVAEMEAASLGKRRGRSDDRTRTRSITVDDVMEADEEGGPAKRLRSSADDGARKTGSK